MSRLSRFAFVFSFLALGALAASGDDQKREVKATATQRAAMDKLASQGADLEAARKRLGELMKSYEAETAAVMSEMRADLKILPSEGFVAYDRERGVFTVAPVATPAGK